MNSAIFSSPLTLILMGIAAVIYILTFFARKTKGLSVALAVISITVHLALMVCCIYIKATIAEFLFVLAASTLLALVASSKGKEGGK